jgi:hypothetical protein
MCVVVVAALAFAGKDVKTDSCDSQPGNDK